MYYNGLSLSTSPLVKAALLFLGSSKSCQITDKYTTTNIFQILEQENP